MPDDVEYTTCLCGVIYRWTDDAEAAEHREHRRPRWTRMRRGGIFASPPQYGPWHLVRGTSRATAACGVGLYRASRYDTQTVSEEPQERLCRKCAAVPLEPWETDSPRDAKPVYRGGHD